MSTHKIIGKYFSYQGKGWWVELEGLTKAKKGDKFTDPRNHDMVWYVHKVDKKNVWPRTWLLVRCETPREMPWDELVTVDPSVPSV